MREAFEYKGVDFEIEITEVQKNKWRWDIHLPWIFFALDEGAARSDTIARHEAVFQAKMAITSHFPHLVYVRQRDNRSFTYTVEYDKHPDGAVTWNSRVYSEDKIRGEPNGRVFPTNLDGKSLHEFVQHLVETSIENGTSLQGG